MKESKKVDSLRINLIFAVVVVLSGVIFSGCARSVLSIGDKSISQVASSQNLYQNKVNVYQNKITALEKVNFYYKRTVGDSQDSIVRWQYGLKIKDNDSLIVALKQKISFLEDQGDEFLIRAGGKDKEDRIHLYGSDPYKLAEAYSLVKYSEKSFSSSDSIGGLIGIVENTTYRKNVIAKIVGPAGFSREFLLGAKQKSPVFKLPMAGNYTVTFIDGLERLSFTKKVGPNIIAYGSDGKKYDFKATLTR